MKTASNRSGPEKEGRLYEYFRGSVDSLPRRVVEGRLLGQAKSLGLEADSPTRCRQVTKLSVSGTHRFFQSNHQVIIEASDSEGLIVTERVYLSRWWLRSYIAAYIGCALLGLSIVLAAWGGRPWLNNLLILAIPSGLILGGALLVGLVSALSVVPLIHTENLDREMDMTHEQSANIPVLVLLLLPTGLILFSVVTGKPLAALLAGLLSVGMAVLIEERYETLATVYAKSRYQQYLPAPTVEFLLSSLSALFPITPLYFAEAVNLPPSNYFGLSCVAGVGMTATVLYISDAERPFVTRMYRHGGTRYVGNRWVSLAFLIPSVAVLWTAIAGVWWVIQSGILSELAIAGRLDWLVFGLLVLPTGYFITGVGVQLWTALRQLVYLSTLSDPLKEPFISDIEVPVYLSKDAGNGPYAFDTPISRGIVIPRVVYDRLDEDLLIALLRHEEAHVTASNDAALSFWIPYLASLLFVGQNLLYSFFDYHDRELNADRYAVRKTDSQALTDALERLDNLHGEQHIPRQLPGFTPTVPGAFETTGQIAKRFGLFYGGFALSQAHPSIEDRKEALRSTPHIEEI